MNNESHITAYPLCWPEGHTRTIGDKAWWAKAPTPGAARDELFSELEKMGATDIILSTNAPATKGGTFYASYKEPKDPGVAVYFTWKGRPRVLACDGYEKMHMNIRAIALTVEQLRRIAGRRVADFMDKAFTGFAALPPASMDSPENWWQVLEVDKNAAPDIVKAAYRALVKKYHPDTGETPSVAMFQKVHKAWSQSQAG